MEDIASPPPPLIDKNPYYSLPHIHRTNRTDGDDDSFDDTHSDDFSSWFLSNVN